MICLHACRKPINLPIQHWIQFFKHVHCCKQRRGYWVYSNVDNFDINAHLNSTCYVTDTLFALHWQNYTHHWQKCGGQCPFKTIIIRVNFLVPRHSQTRMDKWNFEKLCLPGQIIFGLLSIQWNILGYFLYFMSFFSGALVHMLRQHCRLNIWK